MVLKRPFKCPTEIHFTDKTGVLVAEIATGRSAAIVTSPFWATHPLIQQISKHPSICEKVISTVKPNPKVSSLGPLVANLPNVELIIAIGGGSVLDTSKAVAVLHALNGDVTALHQHLSHSTALPDGLDIVPIVAIPTTAGTGSEVTPWGTLWGEKGQKYSVSDARLYPSHALLDPSLTLSMPSELTLATGLDALSHALEAIWNKNHNPLTDLLAQRAIHSIYTNLPQALASPESIEVRATMQVASLTAGLAMGNTQTALAHSISYPLTSNFNIAHGIACSFTLAEIAEYNLEKDPQRLTVAANGLSCDVESVPVVLEHWLKNLDIGSILSRSTTIDEITKLGDSLVNPQRAKNNIRDVSGVTAQKIAQSAFKALATK